jgi:hypothetical protein
MLTLPPGACTVPESQRRRTVARRVARPHRATPATPDDLPPGRLRAILDDLVRSLEPDGEAEAEAVTALARAMLRLERANRWERAVIAEGDCHTGGAAARLLQDRRYRRRFNLMLDHRERAEADCERELDRVTALKQGGLATLPGGT